MHSYNAVNANIKQRQHMNVTNKHQQTPPQLSTINQPSIIWVPRLDALRRCTNGAAASSCVLQAKQQLRRHLHLARSGHRSEAETHGNNIETHRNTMRTLKIKGQKWTKQYQQLQVQGCSDTPKSEVCTRVSRENSNVSTFWPNKVFLKISWWRHVQIIYSMAFVFALSPCNRATAMTVINIS